MTLPPTKLPIAPTRFLLPQVSAERTEQLSHWPVIACDQFSTDPSYWQAIASEVGSDPSLLHCIIRDTELRSPDLQNKITAVHQAMAAYRQSLVPTAPGVMVVERWLPGVTTPRQGVVLTVDLEQYDFRQLTAPIRPTERTVSERLPIRHQVRLGASLDISHIMVLIDDPDRKVIEPLFRQLRTPTYAVDLMQGGGSVTGSLLADGDAYQEFFDRFGALAGGYKDRYHVDAAADPLLIAVGDGNHSLAAAKLAWESIKAKGVADAQHPSRYALVELCNLHSRAVAFQPIHRLVKGVSAAQVVELALGHFAGSSFRREDSELDFAALYARMIKNQEMAGADQHQLPIKGRDVSGVLTIPAPKAKLEIGTITELVDVVAGADGWDEGRVAFVHGDDELDRLVAAEQSAVGLHAPRLDKYRFFESIIKDGPLPAKAFSIGEAHEKRYYLETRSLLPL